MYIYHLISIDLQSSRSCNSSHCKAYKYYNLKVSKGLDLKKGDKVWLLYKNFSSRQLNKKLNYIKLGLFIVKGKVTKVNYKLDLPKKIKMHLVQHITILKPAYKKY